MTPLSFRNADISPTPASPEKDWANQISCPSLSVSGKQAVAMGAESLKVGDVFEAPVRFKVKSMSKSEQDGGKGEFSMSLDMQAMGDMTECEDDGETNGGDAEDTKEGDMPMSDNVKTMMANPVR